MLFAWLECGPQAEEEAVAAVAAGKPFVSDNVIDSGTEWGVSLVPNDYLYWMEQGLDPSHANYLHHPSKGLGLRECCTVMPAVMCMHVGLLGAACGGAKQPLLSEASTYN